MRWTGDPVADRRRGSERHDPEACTSVRLGPMLFRPRRLAMAVIAATAREMALSLEETSEAPHFHRVAFRTPRKTFATLDAEACDLQPDVRS